MGGIVHLFFNQRDWCSFVLSRIWILDSDKSGRNCQGAADPHASTRKVVVVACCLDIKIPPRQTLFRGDRLSCIIHTERRVRPPAETYQEKTPDRAATLGAEHLFDVVLLCFVAEASFGIGI